MKEENSITSTSRALRGGTPEDTGSSMKFEHTEHIPTQLTFPILRGGKVGMTNEEKAAVKSEGMVEQTRRCD